MNHSTFIGVVQASSGVLNYTTQSCGTVSAIEELHHIELAHMDIWLKNICFKRNPENSKEYTYSCFDWF